MRLLAQLFAIDGKICILSARIIDSEMEDGSICPGDWSHLIPNLQSGLCCLPKAKGGRQQTNAKDTQRALKDYLNTTEGSVE